MLTCSSSTFCCIDSTNVPNLENNPRACCASPYQTFTAGFAAYLAGPSVQTQLPTSSCLGWRCSRTMTTTTTSRYTYRPTSTARSSSRSSRTGDSIESTRNIAIGVICAGFGVVVLLCLVGIFRKRQREERALTQVQVQVQVETRDHAAARESGGPSPPTYEAVMANRA